MKLRHRYLRLTLWNKIAFWGSVASILGFLGFIVFGIVQYFGLKPQRHVQYEIPSTELQDQEPDNLDEPLLVRTFWLLREPGTSITLGPCPGDKCLKFVLGELEQKDGVLVQKVYVEASFIGFKKHPKYPDIKFLDIGFHSKGCALVYSNDGSRVWFSLALLKGRMCEVFSRVWNIGIEVLDTRTDSLRIKLEVRPGEKKSLPFDIQEAKIPSKNDSRIPKGIDDTNKLIEKHVSLGLSRMNQLHDKNDIKGALIEVKNILRIITKDQYPELYLKLRTNEGYCYLTMGIDKNSEEYIKKAINIFEETLPILNNGRHTEIDARLRANLGTAYFRLSEFENEKVNLTKSISAYENSLEGFEKLGIYKHHDRLRSNLTGIRVRLNNIK